MSCFKLGIHFSMDTGYNETLITMNSTRYCHNEQ